MGGVGPGCDMAFCARNFCRDLDENGTARVLYGKECRGERTDGTPLRKATGLWNTTHHKVNASSEWSLGDRVDHWWGESPMRMRVADDERRSSSSSYSYTSGSSRRKLHKRSSA